MDLHEKIDILFNPKSVAIIGASRTIGKWGFTFTLHLTQGQYKGAVYPINPAGGNLLGHKLYRSLKEIPGPVDLAFILLPPEKVAEAIAQCGEIGVPAIVVITAGFQELGSVGRILEEEVAAAARATQIAMVGPNCAGISSPYPMKLYCMMQPNFPPPGNIALVSQSGNIAGSIQHICWKQDIGISRCVSVGNQALLKTEDFLEYFITDEQTKVVIAYLESVSDGKRFMDVARRLTSVKPLILIKGGQTATGVRAAKSHTGAIAGSDAVFEGMCQQCGIIRVNDVEDMFDTAVAVISQPLPEGNRVGIVANGGGWGVLTADACIEAGLDVVELPEEALEALDKRLPPWWNRQNPVDMVAGMSRGAFFKAIETLAKTEVIDGLIVLGFGYANAQAGVFGTVPDTQEQNISEYVKGALYSDTRGMNFILDIIAQHQKPVLLSSEFIVGADRDQNEAVLALRRENVVIYPSSRRPARVLARMARYNQYLKSRARGH
ncbi:MAG: CoA-binding protein [Deltaproteobacteria bacterium]|nr:CoA-binding protein [Deltaproteobacteria bacterium]